MRIVAPEHYQRDRLHVPCRVLDTSAFWDAVEVHGEQPQALLLAAAGTDWGGGIQGGGWATLPPVLRGSGAATPAALFAALVEDGWALNRDSRFDTAVSYVRLLYLDTLVGRAAGAPTLEPLHAPPAGLSLPRVRGDLPPQQLDAWASVVGLPPNVAPGSADARQWVEGVLWTALDVPATAADQLARDSAPLASIFAARCRPDAPYDDIVCPPHLAGAANPATRCTWNLEAGRAQLASVMAERSAKAAAIAAAVAQVLGGWGGAAGLLACLPACLRGLIITHVCALTPS